MSQFQVYLRPHDRVVTVEAESWQIDVPQLQFFDKQKKLVAVFIIDQIVGWGPAPAEKQTSV
jgi:hypothetical protein